MNLTFAEAVKVGLESNRRILKKKEKIRDLKRKLVELNQKNDWQWETSIEGRAVSDNTRTTSQKKLASLEGEKTFKHGLTLNPELYLKEKDLLEDGLDEDDINFKIELEQPIYPFRLTKAERNYHKTELKLAQAEAQLEELERDLLVDWLEDYLELIELRLEEEIKDEEYNLAKEHLEEAREEYEEGRVKKKELLKIQIDSNEARQDIEEVKNRFQKDLRDLVQKLGLAKEQKLKILVREDCNLDWLAQVENELPNLNNRNKLLSLAQASSKELAINRLKKEQIEKKAKSEEDDQKPELNLNADYDLASDKWEVALNLTGKLFNKNEDKLLREELKDELMEIDRKSNDYLYELKTEIDDLVGEITVDELKVREEQLRLERADLELKEAEDYFNDDDLTEMEYQEEKLDYKKAELKLKKKEDQLLISKYELIKLLGRGILRRVNFE